MRHTSVFEDEKGFATMVVSNTEIKWKYARYPGWESDAKLGRIKLLRGEPGGGSKQ